MVKWPHSIVSAIGQWRLEWRIRRASAVIVREIYPELWDSVRRKIASDSARDLREYAQVRAAQLSQEQVDVLVRASPTLPGAFATQVLVKATNRATELVVTAAASARRSAA